MNIVNIILNNLLITIIFITFFIISYYYYMRRNIKHVVVFDLDETIGCFQQFGIFCDALEIFNKKKLTRDDFIEILDLYPEYFRPNLFNIMKFLKEKKIKGDLQKVCLYTNNNGPKEWARRICLYIDNKIDYKLFDNHIGAYMVGGKQIERNRTTHKKTIDDFLSTTRFSQDIKICFIDDLYHEKMDTTNVYYIHVDPYNKILPIEILTGRYLQKYNLDVDPIQFNKIIKNYMNKINISDIHNNNIDHNQNGKEILKHLEKFLSSSKLSEKQTKKKTLRNNTSKKKY